MNAKPSLPKALVSFSVAAVHYHKSGRLIFAQVYNKSFTGARLA